ncbi:MAG: polymerase subunit sigma-70 [Roseomonas sp.]|nr:polymerase subunit sigma-70 [Roseomonas sp.]
MFLSLFHDAAPPARIEPAIAPRAETPATLLRDRAVAADEVLIVWSAAGDRLAFDQLALRHLPRLYRLAHRITHDAAAAEDVAQEAMLRAWQAASRFDPARASFGTWLHRIAANLAIDRARQAGRTAAAPGEDLAAPGPDPEQQAARRQQRTLVTAALAEMPARQRAALALFYDQEMEGAQAAALLSISTRALEGLLRRARRFLGQRLLGGE